MLECQAPLFVDFLATVLSCPIVVLEVVGSCPIDSGSMIPTASFYLVFL